MREEWEKRPKCHSYWGRAGQLYGLIPLVPTLSENEGLYAVNCIYICKNLLFHCFLFSFLMSSAA